MPPDCFGSKSVQTTEISVSTYLLCNNIMWCSTSKGGTLRKLHVSQFHHYDNGQSACLYTTHAIA